MPSAVSDMLWILGIAGALSLLAGLHDTTAAKTKLAVGTVLLLVVFGTVLGYDLIAKGLL